MTSDHEQSRKRPLIADATREKHAARVRRLGEALRANLRRRKAQARQRSDGAPPDDDAESR